MKLPQENKSLRIFAKAIFSFIDSYFTIVLTKCAKLDETSQVRNPKFNITLKTLSIK